MINVLSLNKTLWVMIGLPPAFNIHFWAAASLIITGFFCVFSLAAISAPWDSPL